MIQQLKLNNFKGIEDEILDLKPLTLLTGLNSTGKSTCFQAILAALYYNNGTNANNMLSSYDFSFTSNRNRNVNAKRISIEVNRKLGKHFCVELFDDDSSIANADEPIDLEDKVYYLSAVQPHAV